MEPPLEEYLTKKRESTKQQKNPKVATYKKYRTVNEKIITKYTLYSKTETINK